MKAHSSLPPVALTIAGSDNSGGAGIQAGLKTFTTLRVYGATAITRVVAENPNRVESIYPMSAKAVMEQMELVGEVFSIKAAKTGMLYSEEIIRAVGIFLRKRKVKLVVDPVMVATSGALLLKKSAVRAMCEEIFPMATLVTPNLDEAGVLLGSPIKNLEEAKEAAVVCARRWKVPFLVKGGHLQLKQAVDIFSDGKIVRSFSSRSVRSLKSHGTGCTYSAAICAHLAHGKKLIEAIRGGKKFINGAIQNRLYF